MLETLPSFLTSPSLLAIPYLIFILFVILFLDTSLLTSLFLTTLLSVGIHLSTRHTIRQFVITWFPFMSLWYIDVEDTSR